MTTCLLLLSIVSADPNPPVIGAKAFSESVVLQEIAAQLIETKGFDVQRARPHAGTGQIWKAMLAGEVDIYVDYTGTISQEILKDLSLNSLEQIEEELAKHGIRVARPLGFANSYALGVSKAIAEEHNLQKISDLKDHPDLVFGLSEEFQERSDGWIGLIRAYGLPHRNIESLDHTLAYRAIRDGDIDVMDIYSTDGSIERYEIVALEDDQKFFPNYDAVFLYREELDQEAPGIVQLLNELGGKIDQSLMTSLNYRVDVKHEPEARVAHDFLLEHLGVKSAYREETMADRLWKHSLEHLFLVVVSLSVAVLIAIPLGVIAAKKKGLDQLILAGAEIIQTIPGLALLIFLMTPVRAIGLSGSSAAPVILALILYSLLPIIRNTYTGMKDIPASMRESAEALGLTKWAQLIQIELPMASRMILAGIKTTAVMNVGYATLGGLIGAGGYGELIMKGLRIDSTAKMMEGAIPAAVLAIVVKSIFELVERYFVPKGLRLATA